MTKKLRMGIALALMAGMPKLNQFSDSSYDPVQRKENWQGNGKRRKPKSR